MDSITLDPRFWNPRIVGPRPPLCGGSPEVDEELEGAVPQEREPEQTTEGDTPFRLEDIADEQQREWLRSREEEMKAGYSKRLNTELQEARELKELQGRLEDPETQQAALVEFNAKYGIELEFEDAPAPERTDPEENEALARLEKLEEAEAARNANDQAAQDAAREQQFQDAIVTGFTALAEQEGFKNEAGLFDPTEIPMEIREHVIANAIALPRLENGLLDMSEAIKSYGAQAEMAVKRAQAGYIRSKDTPVVDLSSEVADPQIDLSSREARLKQAEAIAGRHT